MSQQFKNNNSTKNYVAYFQGEPKSNDKLLYVLRKLIRIVPYLRRRCRSQYAGK